MTRSEVITQLVKTLFSLCLESFTYSGHLYFTVIELGSRQNNIFSEEKKKVSKWLDKNSKAVVWEKVISVESRKRIKGSMLVNYYRWLGGYFMRWKVFLLRQFLFSQIITQEHKTTTEEKSSVINTLIQLLCLCRNKINPKMVSCGIKLGISVWPGDVHFHRSCGKCIDYY